MIIKNEYGCKCVKCDVWVNPHEGFSFILNSNVICLECHFVYFRDIMRFLNNAVGVVNKDVNDANETNKELQ